MVKEKNNKTTMQNKTWYALDKELQACKAIKFVKILQLFVHSNPKFKILIQDQ